MRAIITDFTTPIFEQNYDVRVTLRFPANVTFYMKKHNNFFIISSNPAYKKDYDFKSQTIAATEFTSSFTVFKMIKLMNWSITDTSALSFKLMKESVTAVGYYTWKVTLSDVMVAAEEEESRCIRTIKTRQTKSLPTGSCRFTCYNSIVVRKEDFDLGDYEYAKVKIVMKHGAEKYIECTPTDDESIWALPRTNQIKIASDDESYRMKITHNSVSVPSKLVEKYDLLGQTLPFTVFPERNCIRFSLETKLDYYTGELIDCGTDEYTQGKTIINEKAAKTMTEITNMSRKISKTDEEMFELMERSVTEIKNLKSKITKLQKQLDEIVREK